MGQLLMSVQFNNIIADVLLFSESPSLVNLVNQVKKKVRLGGLRFRCHIKRWCELCSCNGTT